MRHHLKLYVFGQHFTQCVFVGGGDRILYITCVLEQAFIPGHKSFYEAFPDYQQMDEARQTNFMDSLCYTEFSPWCPFFYVEDESKPCRKILTEWHMYIMCFSHHYRSSLTLDTRMIKMLMVFRTHPRLLITYFHFISVKFCRYFCMFGSPLLLSSVNLYQWGVASHRGVSWLKSNHESYDYVEKPTRYMAS